MKDSLSLLSKNPLTMIYKYWQYHYLFLVIGLIFGLMLVFSNPPWHTNDEDRHFYNAYALSQGNIGPQVKDGKMGHPMPANLIKAVQIHQGLAFNQGQLISKAKLKELESQPLDINKTEFCENVNAVQLPFPYIPSSIMIKIGMLFNDNPIWIGWWGRIGALLSYLIIIFWAIKIIPYFKPLLTLIALSPMALYQGASVTYDTLNLAFLFLLFALVIKFYYQKTVITFKQILLFCLIAFLHRCSKDGYFILYFSIFAISYQKFENKKLYLLTFVFLLLANFLPSYLWNQYLSYFTLPSATLQRDFIFNSNLNLTFHTQHPFYTFWIAIENVFYQGKVWLSGCVGRFGYSYTLLPDWLIFLQLLACVFVVINEKPDIPLSNRFKYILLGFGILNILAIIFGFLIMASPVGANLIYGLQGRYFIPMLPYLFLGLFYVPIFKGKELFMSWSIPIYSILVLTYTVYFIHSEFYIP